ncbi:MAG: ferrous iron transport protein B [Candidatus Sericytochromatia bacterium]|nr:ferrous iron transport protein B [Candidatus Sericytochromatia bacterium]
MKTFLLIGFPNSGKSTIFNLLSGKSRKVSNYSGITVDTGVAELKSNFENEEKIRIIDLPGIYNLLPTSIDEAITVSTILNLNNKVKEFNHVIMIIDTSRFDASLALALSMKDVLGDNISLLINKSDLLYKNKNVDVKKLESLTGLKVLICSAQKDDKTTEKEIDMFLRQKKSDESLKPITAIPLNNQAISYFPFKVSDFSSIEIIDDEEKILDKIYSFQMQARKIIQEITMGNNLETVQTTYRIDKILLHPFLGGICFFAIFFLIFQSLYTFSAPLMTLIESSVKISGDFVGSHLPDGLFKSLVVNGIFAGVGGVLVFLPQIAILFFLLSLMEQSGYIARAAFITDKIMSYFGLNGKAFLPFLSGFACAVPAIMSTRTIHDRGERMATLMTIPLITCSARLPVYILLIGTFIPSYKILGILDSQAMALFFLYFLGSVFALFMAKIFRLSFFKSKSKSFFIEMPIYQKPKLKIAFRQMFRQAKVFLKKAGTTIFALSIIIWFLSSFPRINLDDYKNINDKQIASIQLEKSVIGNIGKFIEPAIKPLGYDWKLGVGIIIAFGARELFVSGMGTIYALGDVDENSKSLRERLRLEKNPETGLPVFNTGVVWSLLVFFAFACQCISTLAIVKKETGGWKWPIVMFSYMTFLAYVGAFLTYHLINSYI